MKYTTRVTINLRGTSLVIANILLNTETSTKIGTAFSPIASGVVRSLSSRNRARRKLIDTPSTVPTSKPISAFRPETFVASQINVVFCWNSAQIAEGAGRKYGWKSKTLTAVSHKTRNPTPNTTGGHTAWKIERGERLMAPGPRRRDRRSASLGAPLAPR